MNFVKEGDFGLVYKDRCGIFQDIYLYKMILFS